MKFDNPNSATSEGTTAEAENQRDNAATWLTAMIATDAGLALCIRVRLRCRRPRASTLVLNLRKRDALLSLVFPAAILVRGLAYFVRLEEDHLRHTLVGVDLGRQRRRVRELERHEAFPFRLERRHVDDDPASRVGRFSERDREHAARDAEVFD